MCLQKNSRFTSRKGQRIFLAYYVYAHYCQEPGTVGHQGQPRNRLMGYFYVNADVHAEVKYSLENDRHFQMQGERKEFEASLNIISEGIWKKAHKLEEQTCFKVGFRNTTVLTFQVIDCLYSGNIPISTSMIGYLDFQKFSKVTSKFGCLYFWVIS